MRASYKTDFSYIRPVTYIQMYALRDQLVAQAFKSTFKYNLYPTAFLNASSYIHLIFYVVMKEGLLYMNEVPTVL